MTARIVCLWVPEFPLAAWLRGDPERAGDLVVIVEGQGATALVVASTERARRAGVASGMTLAQARMLATGLVARARDAIAERCAREALGDAAESLTPRVEDAGEGLVFLDGDGLERRHPSESALAEAARRAARGVGLAVRVGVASSKRVACVAARIADDIRIVPAGHESAFLEPLDVSLLDPAPEIAAVLDAWGVRTVGELARLDPGEVASRLGRAGRDLCVAARGIDSRPLVPRSRPPLFQEGMELEWPLESLEPFQFVARAALDRLAERLAARGLAVSRLRLELTLDPRGHDVRTLELPAPTREVKTLLELTRLSLEERAPGAAVVGFRFVAEPAAPRQAQGTLFGPPQPSPEKLATAMARLGARLGAARIGSPGTVDGHRPERFTRLPYAPPEIAEDHGSASGRDGRRKGKSRAARSSTPMPREKASSLGSRPRMRQRGIGVLAVRVLRPPVSLEVVVTEGGLVSVRSPSPFQASGASREKSARSTVPIEGLVRIASGPWVLEEGWWSETPATRDYWDVELADGALYRIFRDRSSGAWFADGVYD